MSRAVPVFWVFVFNILLLAGMVEANHLLAPFGVSLHLHALFILFAGLYLRVLHGALLAIVIGGMLDAIDTPGFGPLLFLMTALWTATVYLRLRIRREVLFQIRMSALGLQAAFLLAATAAFGGGSFGVAAFWQRLAVDAVLSLALVTLLGPVWVHLQIRLLESFRWDIASERPDG
ncbi:MAG: hypothetical protein JJU00_15150 [Opitutales bacterium]|nr:hypothetical protein [Opitutales bacterium]